jgi:hypothetical protein
VWEKPRIRHRVFFDANFRDAGILMNGEYAEGVRIIEPLQSNPTRHRIDEIRSAPDLNLVIKTYLDDGNGFIEGSALKNIDRSEPDSGLVPRSDLPPRQAPETDPVWNESYGVD